MRCSLLPFCLSSVPLLASVCRAQLMPIPLGTLHRRGTGWSKQDIQRKKAIARYQVPEHNARELQKPHLLIQRHTGCHYLLIFFLSLGKKKPPLICRQWMIPLQPRRTSSHAHSALLSTFSPGCVVQLVGMLCDELAPFCTALLLMLLMLRLWRVIDSAGGKGGSRLRDAVKKSVTEKDC